MNQEKKKNKSTERPGNLKKVELSLFKQKSENERDGPTPERKKTFFVVVKKVKGVDERRQRGCLRHHGV